MQDLIFLKWQQNMASPLKTIAGCPSEFLILPQQSSFILDLILFSVFIYCTNHIISVLWSCKLHQKDTKSYDCNECLCCL